jgi:hypothetical protein
MTFIYFVIQLKGHVMTEHETLASLHVVDGATIDVVVMTTTTTTTSSSPSSTTTTSSTTPSSRTPSYRDQMRQLASNPMMRALLSNPESLRAMLQMNPQMQRLMQTNPDVAAMLNSDSMLRQIADAALNPETLSQDRALQHIESMPGGGAALARAWQQVAEPMLDSLTPQVAEPDENLGELDESAPFPNAWSPNANAPPASSPFAVNPFLQPPASASPFGMSPAQSFAFLNSPMAQQMLSDPSFMQSLSNFQQQRPASLFAGGASPFGVRPAPVSNETLAARYSSQLALMDDMGFTDRVQNIDALRATNGDVDAAVERIAAALEAKEESATTHDNDNNINNKFFIF